MTGEDSATKLADLEARIVALQTLVGDLLKTVHQTAPAELDKRLDAARQRRNAPQAGDATGDIAREAVHLEIAMLEAAVRNR